MSTNQESDGVEQERDKQSELGGQIQVKEATYRSVLRKLTYFNRATVDVLQANVRGEINRHHSLLQSKVNEARSLIQDIQCLKIDADENDDDIDQWTNDSQRQLHTFEIAIGELSDQSKTKEKELEERQYNEKRTREAEIRERLRSEDEEAEIERRKREEHFALSLEEKKLEIAERKRIRTKLPDLQISKFQGTHLDWVRFWNLFETQIEQAPLKDEAKFAYLKELLVPKVRATIEKLPQNSDGYRRAIAMLQQRYGDVSEVVNAHIQQILSLPVIYGTSKPKIHSFYDSLLSNVQALETLGKLSDVAGNVRMTLDKLAGIRGDLIRTDDEWKKWTFTELVEALRQWIERNPLQQEDKDTSHKLSSFGREKSLSTRDNIKQRQCVYCDSGNHRSTDCEKITDVTERRKILSIKRRCFNCTGEKHRASECRSKIKCYHCQKRHHTSICDSEQSSHEQLRQANGKVNEVVFPVVMVEIEGTRWYILRDFLPHGISGVTFQGP